MTDPLERHLLHVPAAGEERDAGPWLSVVAPVHDEAPNLALLHAELVRALVPVAGSVEFLYVDDGSRDGSAKELVRLAEADGRVRVLFFEERHGQSAALDAGIRAARGEITVMIDADLQNDPADIPTLLACLDRADVANGIRTRRRDTWSRRVASLAANRFRRWLLGGVISDESCTLRAVRTSFLRDLDFYDGMHRFLPTLLEGAGARVVEVPVHHRERRFGRSKYGILRRSMQGLVDALVVRWMQRRRLTYRVRELERPSDPDA